MRLCLPAMLPAATRPLHYRTPSGLIHRSTALSYYLQCCLPPRAFERNPHAHKPPANCYGDAVMSGRAYGTRNAYWMAFAGETVAPPPKEAEEL